MAVFYVLLAILIVFLMVASVFTYLFFYTFVRRKKPYNIDESLANEPTIKPYLKLINDGVRYCETQPFEHCYTKSYDGKKLHARLYKTENAKGTIILFHGYRSLGLRDFSVVVGEYKRFKFNVLMTDMRAHGLSEGKIITYGVKDRYDVLTWVDYVTKNISNDEKIIIDGLSMGSSTVLMASELDLPDNVKGIVADSGFTSPREIINIVGKKLVKFNCSFATSILNIYCKIFGKFSLDVSTVDAVKKCKIPILFIHGKSDNFVPYEMTIRNYESATCPKKLVLVDNADHGISFLIERDRIIKELEEFLLPKIN